MKRFVSMLLTLCLLCSMAVPGAFAQDVSIPTADSAEAPLGLSLIHISIFTACLPSRWIWAGSAN